MSTNSGIRTVLIAGASIAGPTLAYWLTRYGFEVTVVEKSPTFRVDGHSVDVSGPTIAIAEKMGILDLARSYNVDIRKVSFVDGEGEPVGMIDIEAISGGDTSTDIEIPRRELVGAIVEVTGDAAEWIYDDSVVAIDNRADAAEVTFSSGIRRSFDLVVGADGVRSRTRRLAMDPAGDAVQYLGYTFALYSMPNFLGLEHENRSWNIPGKMAVMLPTESDTHLHAMLAFATPEPPAEIFGTREEAYALFAEQFAGYGWEIPRFLEELRTSDDSYYDSANYVASPQWSTGRVALVGDAGYGPSLFTGQGSTMAMIGAYILAGELARGADLESALASYDALLRPFVEATQAGIEGMVFQLAPRSEGDLAARNAAISDPAIMAAMHDQRPAPASITLPDYSELQAEHAAQAH
ncbi:FAD-dependent monooxygenase [Herbiconiux daphne]|uniref:FAD-dependent monooxygenase n=1 Tax=Herbiconiux daphne TaxID=2970914 RepID=A0ABT2H3M8_9MICO|nr:FAD-dependent monooxygenase [Herbiconiux daphne]MCS5734538.1 FAD-dependent monooxygenase [Herbiconiux daphne]